MNPHRHIVPEDFFGAERADRLSANELARDIIEQGVRGERRHPGLDIVGVAGGDMVGNRLGQAVGDVVVIAFFRDEDVDRHARVLLQWP